MYLKYILFLIFFIISFRVEADEILLKDGKIWVNVNVLEDLETYNGITIFTSMRKKITIKKDEIASIKKKEFNSLKKSELLLLDEHYLKDFDEYQPNSEGELIKNYQKIPSKIDSLLLDLPKLRLNVEGGYSYRTAKIPSDMPSDLKIYIEDLMKGYNFAIDLTYFFNTEYGIGIKYSNFSASNFMDNVSYYNELTDESGVGSMEDNISLSFIGVGITNRKLLGNGNTLLIGNLSAGQLSYNNDSRVIDLPLDIEGSTFGLHALVGLDFFVSEKLGLGGSLSYIIGSLSKIKVNGTNISFSENESLNRFDFNVGLKYYF